MPRQQSQADANEAYRRRQRQNSGTSGSSSSGSDDYVDPDDSKINKGLSALAAATKKKAEDQADAIEEAKPPGTEGMSNLPIKEKPKATPTPSPSATPPANESPLARASRLARERRERDRNR